MSFLKAIMHKLKAIRGQLLLELLLGIAVAGIILGVAGNLIYSGLRANQVSIERETAQGLLEETMEAVKANAVERWTCGTPASDCAEKFIYDLDKGSTNLYYPVKDADSSSVSYKWINHTPSGSSVRWGTDDTLAISALSPKDVWIGTYGGEIWQFNGEVWIDRTTGTDFSSIYDIAAVASTDVWVVGNGGRVYKWNGNSWDSHIGTTTTWGISGILSISATGPKNVWIVGLGGHAWQYDGSSWVRHVGAWTTTPLYSVSALGDEAWVGSNIGTLFRYDGVSWTEDAGYPGSDRITSISFVSETDLLVSDFDQVYEKNGSTWSDRTRAGGWGTGSSGVVLSAFSPTSVLLVSGRNLWSYDGTDANWTLISDGSTPAPAKWGTSDLYELSDRFSTALWVGGEDGNLWQFKGARWRIDNSGSESVAIPDGISYSRNFYVENVCRDGSGDIVGVTSTACSGGTTEDPSTQKITAKVTWGGESLTSSEFVTRWLSYSCVQTQWGGAVLDVTRVCPAIDYSSASNITAGDSLAITTPVLNGSGTLTSAIFDTTGFTGTGAGTGPVYNFLRWEGASIDSNDQVKIQFAASDCPNGSTNPPTCTSDTWAYYGGDSCSPGAYYTWTGSTDIFGQKEINCPELNGKRFLRYRVQLCSQSAPNCPAPTPPSTDDGPQVDSVIINYTP